MLWFLCTLGPTLIEMCLACDMHAYMYTLDTSDVHLAQAALLFLLDTPVRKGVGQICKAEMARFVIRLFAKYP